MTQEPNSGSCERSQLLLSLSADAAATPSQLAELEAHLPTCDACRRAVLADAAVRSRLLERADAPAPPWLDGFAGRVARLAMAQAREARSQNRLLWMSAAAALVVAVTAQLALPGGALTPRPAGSPGLETANQTANQTAAVRESTRVALIHSLRLPRAGEGK